MGMNFPDVPTNGQVSGPYTWDGEKWVVTSSASPPLDQATGDARYVNVSGDQMTGPLALSYVNPTINMVRTAAGQACYIAAYNGANPRWLVTLGDGAAESGSNAGSNFNLTRYNDAGTPIGTTLTVYRNSGALACEGTITSGIFGATGTYYFGNSGTKSLQYDGTNFRFSGGTLLVDALNIYAGFGGTTGTYQFGNTGTKSLTFDSVNFNFNGGNLFVNGADFYAAKTATTGGYYFGNSGTKYLSYDGTSFNLAGGQLLINSNTIGVGLSGTTGYCYFGNSATKYLQFDGTNFNLVGGPLNHIAILGGTPPPGYGHGFGYGGATQYGIGMRPINDAVHNALSFLNAAGTTIGSIAAGPASVAFNTTSSAELKEDLKSFDAGSIIDQTNVYDFKWKSAAERGFGVLAQQAIEVYPTAVTHLVNPEGDKEEYWGVDYSKYVPVLLQELKALRTRVAQLEGRIDAKPA